MGKVVTKRTTEQKMMEVWWMRLVLAVIFLAIAYGFASLAIDSGSLIEYLIALIFIWWGIAHAVRGIRSVLAR